MNPSSNNTSKSIKYGFPANTEKQEYGESPYEVWPIGKICQYFCPAERKKSINL